MANILKYDNIELIKKEKQNKHIKYYTWISTSLLYSWLLGSVNDRNEDYRHWFPKLLRWKSSGGCRFNPDCRRVTIQEYLTLVPGYG